MMLGRGNKQQLRGKRYTELVAAFPELTSGISASGVRMKSRFNDLNPVIPSWNTYSIL